MGVYRSNETISTTGDGRQESPTTVGDLINIPARLLSDNSTAYPEANNSSFATVSQQNLSVTYGSSSIDSGLMLSVFQWIIFVVGTTGNFLVLIVLAWHRSPKQRVAQLFVASLSVADLGMMLGGAWVQALVYVENNWRFGQAFCKCQFSMQILMINCAIWTLAVLAMDRLAEQLF